MNEQIYYSQQSKISSPGKYSYLFNDLRSDIPFLCNFIQNLIIHYADENLLGYDIPKDRYVEMNNRHVSEILGLLLKYDSNFLNEKRNLCNCVVGVCRDTSVLLCSILRHHEIPARLRVGFCPYFIKGIYLDGMCVEYWDKSREKWTLVDTRTSLLHIKKYKLNLNFSLYDIPKKLFVSAAEAWQLCRSGKANPLLFGSRHHRGLHFIQDRLIQEFAVLNKKEVLLWDRWGMMLDYSRNSPCNNEQLKLLDDLSNFVLNNLYQVEKLEEYYNNNKVFQIKGPLVMRNPFLPLRTIKFEKEEF